MRGGVPRLLSLLLAILFHGKPAVWPAYIYQIDSNHRVAPVAVIATAVASLFPYTNTYL